jgi:hypothetical protein
MGEIEPRTSAPETATFAWDAIDESGATRIKFLTAAERTGDSFADLSENAMRRLICLFIVSHLSSKHLSEAYESLVDLYSWQLKGPLITPVQPVEQTVPSPAQVQVERVPFAFREE